MAARQRRQKKHPDGQSQNKSIDAAGGGGALEIVWRLRKCAWQIANARSQCQCGSGPGGVDSLLQEAQGCCNSYPDGTGQEPLDQGCCDTADVQVYQAERHTSGSGSVQCALGIEHRGGENGTAD